MMDRCHNNESRRPLARSARFSPRPEGGQSLASALALIGLTPLAAAQSWPQYARSPDRLSLADSLPSSLTPRWTCTQDPAASPISFAPQSGLVADRTRVFALGKVGSQWKLFAISAETGAVWWAAPVPAPLLDSWSSPALDDRHNTVLIASGNAITALDTFTGQQIWRTTLARSIVNASPLLTPDTPARAFITDYDGFGGAAQLYCINLDPVSPSNPFAPGAVVWSVPIGGASGSTPGYASSTVYLATITDQSGLSPGQILAYPAAATSPPSPLWTYTNTVNLGFFGGVSVANGSVYAASYALSGGQLAANLVKLDAATGAQIWSTPCNRTDATPIPLASGSILLSTGVRGYGSAPSLELFADQGSGASLLWDSALDTWTDANGNGVIDPGESLAVGSWTFQPVVSQSGPTTRALAGTPPTASGSFATNTDLYLLDLTKFPHEPGFIIDHAAGAGGTPAAAFGSVYSVGTSGLTAFGSIPCYANCDQSTASPILNVADFTCFLMKCAAADPYANCDGSTVAPALNVADFTCFLTRYAAGCP
jgi:outer membrane protein assembly factor BamB